MSLLKFIFITVDLIVLLLYPPITYPFLGTEGVIELLALLAVDVPFAFTAAKVKVYAVPLTKVPVIVTGLVVPEVDKEIEGLLVAV